MMNKLILFLVRRKLKVKKNQRFQFKNQAVKDDFYRIDDECVIKETHCRIGKNDRIIPFIDESNISLNFLLSHEAQKLIKRY